MPSDIQLEPTTFIVRKVAGTWQAHGPDHASFGEWRTPRTAGWTGVGARWDWDGERLEVQTDRFGFFPLFFHGSAELLGVSDSLLDLLSNGAPSELDDEGLATFLRLGFFVGERTPFRGIRTLPPGSHLLWEDGKVNISVEDRPPPSTTQQGKFQAQSEYGDRFQAAVENILPSEDETISLPLSGGRDSRHILLALAEAERLPDVCLTQRHFRPKADEDARIAAELCSEVGVRHVVVSQTPRRLRAELRKNVKTHFCSDEHAWILPLADRLGDSRSVIFDGIAGDVLSAGLFLDANRLQLYDSGDLEPLAQHLLGGEGYLPRMLRPEWYRRWSREAAVAQLTAELERHRGAPNPVGQFFFWNRTRREIALSTYNLLGASNPVLAPFLHPTIYDFLYALPAHYFLDQSFHSETIAARYPRFADVPYEAEDTIGDLPRFTESVRFVSGFLRYLAQNRFHTPSIRTLFFTPRIVKGLLRPSYRSSLPAVLLRPVYLQQLHQVSELRGL